MSVLFGDGHHDDCTNTKNHLMESRISALTCHYKIREMHEQAHEGITVVCSSKHTRSESKLLYLHCCGHVTC